MRVHTTIVEPYFLKRSCRVWRGGEGRKHVLRREREDNFVRPWVGVFDMQTKYRSIRTSFRPTVVDSYLEVAYSSQLTFMSKLKQFGQGGARWRKQGLKQSPLKPKPKLKSFIVIIPVPARKCEQHIELHSDQATWKLENSNQERTRVVYSFGDFVLRCSTTHHSSS